MPRKFRIGVIGRTGKGNYGHALDTAWQEIPNAEIAAVADDNKGGLLAAGRKLKVNRTFSDYREMLDKIKPDVAAICPRWVDQHRDMAVAAAERGIHVYMEKPLCRTLEEADEIVAACERTHVKLAIAHPTHYSPKLQTIKKLIAEGKIGTVLEYRARGKEDSRGGGLDLWALGTHVLDMIRVLGGHPKSCFATVTQNGKPVGKQDVFEGAEGIGPLAGDALHARFGMPDGSTAYFASQKNMRGNPSRYGLQIFGSKGVIEVIEGVLPPVKFLPDPSWSPGRSGVKWQDVSSAGVGKPEPLQGKQYTARHYLAIVDFLKAIQDDRQPLDGMYEARGVVEMIAAVFESHRQGGPVPLPLKNRKNPLTMLR